MRAFILSLLMTTPAWAETPMTGDEFEALVEGKTLTFSTGSSPYGVEYYAPNRRVVWSFRGGDCVKGEWFEDITDSGANICFIYENNVDPQCWQVFDVDGKIRADFMNTPGTTVLYEAVETEPLICGGLGV
ncbi:MAG: hypothetical protein ACSHWY_09245 [Octadecabacter sp.]